MPKSKSHVYTVEFTSSHADPNDMPYNVRARAKNIKEARKKFWKHMKKNFPGDKIKIDSIYRETLKIKRVDIK